MKSTVKADEAPGASDSGVASPERVKVVPAKVACERVSVAVPVFLMVTDCVLVAPTETPEKLTLDRVTDIWG